MKKLVLSGLVVGVMASLSGCAGLQQVNDSLAKVNSALSGAGAQSLQVGGGSGYSPTIMVTVPANVCDRAAFDAGARYGYVSSWNDMARQRATMFQLQASSSHSSAAKRNGAMWAGKQIGTAGLASPASYEMQVGVGVVNCRYNSFTEGSSAGQEASLKDFQAMQAGEVQ